MNRQSSVVLGLALITLGMLAMAFTVGLPILGLSVWGVFNIARFWPLTVISVGLGFVLPPFLFRERRGLGGLFIPGMPVLTTGGILLLASVFNWWSAWSWLWPQEVLSVAVGLTLAAIHMRVIWLMIPAIIVGANGLLFQFCAITGLWEVWAVMWAIEPLSVGISLLLIGARRRRPGLMTAGLLLCGIGGVALFGMAAIMSVSWIVGWWWIFRLVAPAMLILIGGLLLLWSLVRRSQPFKVG